MVSLMTGGMYQSLFQIFSADALITVGISTLMLGIVYVKAHIKSMKDAKIERDFKKLDLANKAKATVDMKNINVSKLFI